MISWILFTALLPSVYAAATKHAVFLTRTASLKSRFEDNILPALLLDGDLYAVFDGQEYASNNWCLINTDAKVVKTGIEASYISPFCKGVSKVSNGSDKYALMKKDGTFISDFIFDEVGLFSHYFIEAKCDGEDVLVDRTDGRMYYCKDFK